MRALDWRRLLDEQRVPYITAGANVSRGEVNIRCPFCGSADPSQHMGISLETGWWSCWRNRAQHSGKSPLRLIMRLLGVPYGRARELAGLGDDYVDPEGFDAAVARFMGRGGTGRPAEVRRRVLRPDDGMEPVTARIRTRRYWNYLYSRGFSLYEDDVDHLVSEYGLLCASSGYWGGRIVCPYVRDGELVTWTGRAIAESSARYLDLALDQALCGAKETLYNHDCMAGGGKALVIQEGPFDVLKTDFYGKAWGVRSVGLSTNSVTDEQAYLLQAAIGRFEQVVVMMDNATGLGLADSARMRAALRFLGDVRAVPVPCGAKDGGELSAEQVIDWARAL